VTPVDKHTNTVMSALMDKETIVPGTDTCRAMLVTAAPAALKVPKDKRHENQEAVIRMVREVFENEKARWESRVADANSELEKATAERTEKVDAKDAADGKLKEQKDVVKSKLEAQTKAMEVVDECMEEHTAALKLLKKAETEKGKLVKTQEHDLSVEEIIKGLKAGSYDNPKDLKTHLASVTALIANFGAEEAFVKTLPKILRIKPEERGSFDEVALQQLDSYMATHLSSLSSKIEDANKTVEEHTVATTAWDATVEVAQDKKQESDEAFNAATTEQEQFQDALNQARKIVKEHTALVKSRDAHLVKEQCGLQVVASVLEALDFLQEYVAPVPEEEPKETENMAESAEIITPEEPADTFEEVVIPATKAKQVDVALNFEDVPSPAKRARQSLGGVVPMVAA